MWVFVQQLVNGLVIGSIYALVALGVTLVYGLTRLVNFAQGEIVTIGAFIAVLIEAAGLPYGVGLAGGFAAGALLSLATERFGFRFTRAVPINGFILSLGLIVVSQAILLSIYGDTPRTIRTPVGGALAAGSVRITYQSLVVMGIAAALAASLGLYLRCSKYGRATRAYAEDPTTTALMGVPTERLIMGVFLLGGGLAGAAGALLLSLFPVTNALGGVYVIKAFAVSLIGGLGSVPGAVCAGLAIGLAETFGAAYVSSQWTDFFGYALMIAVLLIRPTGLFRGTQGAQL